MKAPGQTPLETYLSTWSSGHDRGADGLNGEWAQRMDRLYKQLYGVDTKEAIQSAVEVVADSRKALERANQDIKNLLSNREYLVHAIVDMQKKLDQLINRSSNSGEEQQLDEGEEPKEGPL
ncbi:hypothetical protein GCM10012289_22800 [Nonomuraea cavernae]|uniref:Uncharacterized protein n=2 Tax=Nonomuraea cavernae TaxID=2045107 RepID=A0A917YXP2_9ACTN|nr:hypothetical protein GCM10012289_22800 [Nonomuraea cavernae]